MLRRLVALDATTWLRAVPIAALAAVMIGVPADLIDTPVFGRPVPTTWVDYVIWAITSVLIGLVFAIRAPMTEREQSRTIWTGFVSFLAVGCPVCNQLVVAAIGVSGALSWWSPVQPLVGLAAVGAALWALRQRLETYELTSCPLPDAVAVGS